MALPGSFWGVTAFFNSSGYRNKYKNYRFFRRHSKEQGLKLLSVELAFDEDPFSLKEGLDAEIVLQIRGTREKNLLWQKERLLNLGLKRLPRNCDKVCWIDCDLLFKNERWIEETARLLEKYILVQPFESVVRLPKGIYDSSEAEIKNFPPHKVRPGLVHQKVHGNETTGEVGFAWAARRSFIEKVLFYDAVPTGGQDVILASAFLDDRSVGKWLRRCSTAAMKAHQDCYARKVRSQVQGSTYYAAGTVLHLWHGSTKERLYVTRWKILRRFAFVPDQDLRLDANGIWEWSSNKPGLHAAIKEYFEMRNEEGKKPTPPSRLWHDLIVAQTRLRTLERHAKFIRASRPYRIARKLAGWALSKES